MSDAIEEKRCVLELNDEKYFAGDEIRTPNGDVGKLIWTDYGEFRIMVDGVSERWTKSELQEAKQCQE